MHPDKTAVLVATLLAARVKSQYTYQVSPCVNHIARQFSATDGLQFSYSSSCASSDTKGLGVAGSSSSCTRSWGILVVQFLLPQIASSSVTGVAFSATVSSSGGGGLPVILHGLGTRTLDRSGSSTSFHAGFPDNQDYGYPLGPSDYYAGSTDPASSSVLINGSFGAAGLADGTVLAENSDALRDYIRALLDTASSDSPTYTALRLSTDDYYGCDSACDGGCRFKRYRFDPAAISLTITVSEPTPPVSAWVQQAGATLQYKTSTEAETAGDKIPDFSGVGYLRGADLPTLREVGGQLVELAPASGDQTTRIQTAIDSMASHSINATTGFRGTLRLGSGTWQVSNTLALGVSGVVLQGATGGSPTIISALESGAFAVSHNSQRHHRSVP